MIRSKEMHAVSRRSFIKRLPMELVEGIRLFTKNLLKDSDRNVIPCVARLDITKCLAWEGLNCQLCYLGCPVRDKAVVMIDKKPVIVAAECDGCAMCEVACRTVNDVSAIEMVSRAVSG